MAGRGSAGGPPLLMLLPRMRSRTPFRPSVFSTLLIAALLAAAALIADTARADHFTGTGQDRDSNFGYRDSAPFGVMCITLGGTRNACFDSGFSYYVHVCDTRGATITTYCRRDKIQRLPHRFCRRRQSKTTSPLKPNSFADSENVGIIPRCHDAFPKCPEGAAYKSTYTYIGTTLDNPLSGCVCPGSKIADGGNCVCPSGQFETADRQDCVAECPTGQVSNGDAENPICIFDCRTHLDDSSENPNAILIAGQSPVAGLESGFTEAGEPACRCPNNAYTTGFIQRKSDGTLECAATCSDDDYRAFEPDDNTLKFCFTPKISGCTNFNGYDPFYGGVVSEGTAVGLCNVWHINMKTGTRSESCIIDHVNPSVSLVTVSGGNAGEIPRGPGAHNHNGDIAPRCGELYSENGDFSGGIPQFYGTRAGTRRVAGYQSCADGTEFKQAAGTDNVAPTCVACEADEVSTGGAACAACPTGQEPNDDQSACQCIFTAVDGSCVEQCPADVQD